MMTTVGKRLLPSPAAVVVMEEVVVSAVLVAHRAAHGQANAQHLVLFIVMASAWARFHWTADQTDKFLSRASQCRPQRSC